MLKQGKSLTYLYWGIVPLQDLHYPMKTNRSFLFSVAQPVLKSQYENHINIRSCDKSNPEISGWEMQQKTS